MKGLKNKILIFLSAILGVVMLVSCNTPTPESTPTITNPVTPTEPTQTEVETESVTEEETQSSESVEVETETEAETDSEEDIPTTGNEQNTPWGAIILVTLLIVAFIGGMVVYIKTKRAPK